MTEKKKQETAFLNEIAYEQAVEALCHQIIDAHQATPDQTMAIVVELATTDDVAIKSGWPSAKMMKQAIEDAIRVLPKKITDRIELEEI